MSLRYALLGLLRDRPASGYELTQRFAQGIGRHAWSAQHSQIYPELHKLTEEGLIEVVDEGTRGKRVYGTTEAGRAELREWLLLSEPKRGTVRNEFLLRLFLISGLEVEERKHVLEGVEEYANGMAEELSNLYNYLAANTDELPTGSYAAKFGIYSYRAMSDWARWAIEQQPGHD